MSGYAGSPTCANASFGLIILITVRRLRLSKNCAQFRVTRYKMATWRVVGSTRAKDFSRFFKITLGSQNQAVFRPLHLTRPSNLNTPGRVPTHSQMDGTTSARAIQRLDGYMTGGSAGGRVGGDRRPGRGPGPTARPHRLGRLLVRGHRLIHGACRRCPSRRPGPGLLVAVDLAVWRLPRHNQHILDGIGVFVAQAYENDIRSWRQPADWKV